MVGAIVLLPTDAASQEAVVSSAQRVVVARARAPRDAGVQYCLEYLSSEYPHFELKGSARSVVYLDEQVGIVVDVPPEVYELVRLVKRGPLPLR